MPSKIILLCPTNYLVAAWFPLSWLSQHCQKY